MAKYGTTRQQIRDKVQQSANRLDDAVTCLVVVQALFKHTRPEMDVLVEETNLELAAIAQALRELRERL